MQHEKKSLQHQKFRQKRVCIDLKTKNQVAAEPCNFFESATTGPQTLCTLEKSQKSGGVASQTVRHFGYLHCEEGAESTVIRKECCIAY